MSISPVIRRRLETQGFVDLDDAMLAEVGPWLRFSPAICTALIGLGTALASPVILGILVPIAVLGAIFPVHPFDLIYNYGLRHLTRTQSLPPNGYSKAEAQFFLANILLYIEDDPDTALAYSEKLASHYHQNTGFLTFLGENYQESGSHAQAIEQLERALAQEAAKRYEFFKMYILFDLGKAHFELNDFRTAIPYFQKAATLASRRGKSSKWMVGRANYRLGLSFELDGERRTAVDYYHKVRKSDHKKAYELAGERIKQPITEIDRTLILGKNLAKTKHYDKAIEMFETAIAQASTDDEKKKIPEVRYHLAKTRYDKGDFEEAIAAFQEVLTLRTKEKWIKAWTHFYLGHCFNETGQPEKTLAEFNTAYKFDDRNLRLRPLGHPERTDEAGHFTLHFFGYSRNVNL